MTLFNNTLFEQLNELLPEFIHAALKPSKMASHAESYSVYYFCRIMTSLLVKFPLRTLRALYSIPGIEALLLLHVKFESIQELLVKIWMHETVPCSSLQWSSLLVSKFVDGELYCCLALSYLEFSSAKANVFRGFDLSTVFWKLMDGPSEIGKISMLELVIAILGKYHVLQDQDDFISSVETFLQLLLSAEAFLSRFLKAINLLDTNAEGACLPKPIGSFSPVGRLKLKGVEFLAEITLFLQSSLPCKSSLLNIFMSLDCQLLLLQCFQRYPWNNFLHSALTDIILILLDSPMTPYMFSCAEKFLCPLLHLEKASRFSTCSYRGHLYVIFQRLAELESFFQVTFASLNPDSLDAWRRIKFTMDADASRNKRILGGGSRPPLYDNEGESSESEASPSEADFQPSSPDEAASSLSNMLGGTKSDAGPQSAFGSPPPVSKNETLLNWNANAMNLVHNWMGYSSDDDSDCSTDSDDQSLPDTPTDPMTNSLPSSVLPAPDPPHDGPCSPMTPAQPDDTSLPFLVDINIEMEQLARFLSLSMLDKHVPDALLASQHSHPITIAPEELQKDEQPQPEKPTEDLGETEMPAMPRKALRRRQSLPLIQPEPTSHSFTMLLANSMSPPPPLPTQTPPKPNDQQP